MGVFGKKCSTNSEVQSAPNPRNFKILKCIQYPNGLVAIVHYPGCTNFEGKKIMVYRNLTEQQFCALPAIDPHFSESGPSPVARFEPTEDGEKMAIFVAERLR